jgi:hypothetical protein
VLPVNMPVRESNIKRVHKVPTIKRGVLSVNIGQRLGFGGRWTLRNSPRFGR